jgi:E3 ubiquitin-protein ligase RNF14
MEELDTLQCIYPELIIDNERSAYLEIPVTLHDPLTLVTSDQLPHDGDYLVSHLPPICMSFELPESYPDETPPVVQLHTKLHWMPDSLARALIRTVATLWEEHGRSEMLYAYIAHVQEGAESAFGMKELLVTGDMLAALRKFDRIAKVEDFNKGTYECGVCLDVKKGSRCYRIEKCGHVFCIDCLQECYNKAIVTGAVDEVKCPSFNCGMENDDAATRRAKKPRLISPQELLRIPLERPAVQRFVDLKRKRKLEADSSTTWCPRKWCQGAAASNKHPLPTVPLEEMDDDYETEAQIDSSTSPSATLVDKDEDEATQDKKVLADCLRICEDCSFAFCKLCCSSWHGEYYDCRSRTESLAGRKQISTEEAASDDFIALHTSPCPKCSTPIQKSEACNHMRCAQCSTHFCYLCGMFLDPTNPYQHFNTEGTPCHQRLWVLEEGDDGEQKVDFGGVRGAEIAAHGVVTEE